MENETAPTNSSVEARHERGAEFLCEYPFGRSGQRWGLTIWATSMEEAGERLKAIGASGEVLGELKMRVPAFVPGAGLFARASTWFLNRFRRQGAP